MRKKRKINNIESIKNNIKDKSNDYVFSYLKEIWNTLSHDEKEALSNYIGNARYKNKFHILMGKCAKGN